MANLLSSLRNSAAALAAFEKGLEVTQNNVANASTPGYARREMALVPMWFNPDQGLPGGVKAGPVESARSEFAERNVRRQLEGLGRAESEAELLAGIETVFPMAGERGITGALNRLLRSFSAWSLTPNDPNARQAVLEEAGGLARSFADAASQLADTARLTEARLAGTMDQIDRLGAQLADLNFQVRSGGRGDAGLDARIHSTLEQLSELVDFTALPQADGSMTVLVGGAVPLVVGDRQYRLRVEYAAPEDPAFPDGPAPARVVDASGEDVTARITGGKLAGELRVRNEVLGDLAGDSSQAGDLNRLAMGLADRINELLSAGWTADGSAPPENLFVYDAANPTAAARTLAVNPAFTAGMLAAADPGPPYVANGTALKLAALAKEQGADGGIDGQGYIQFYAGMAARVGRYAAEAREAKQLQSEFTAQARGLRTELSGVSLDDEAMRLVEYQRAYQAAARMISAISELTEIAVNLLR